MALGSIFMADTQAEGHVAQIHYFKSKSPDASKFPVLVLLPGGASFSSKSWGSLDPLLDSFDVVAVDPPGTGGAPRLQQYDYHQVIQAMEASLRSVQRPMAFLGISFGVIYAAELATRGKLNAKAFFGFAGPVDWQSYQKVSAKTPVEDRFTPEMHQREKKFLESPNDETWKAYLSVLTPMYFTEKFQNEGRKLLTHDVSEYRSYLQVFFPYAEGKIDTGLPQRVKLSRLKKVLIGAEKDLVVNSSVLKEQAKEIGCQFELVTQAGHFVLVEQPKQVVAILKKYLSH
jgi:pimeloyl-ACP methyl ester carboxylesterase